MYSEGAGYFDVRSERAFNACELPTLVEIYLLAGILKYLPDTPVIGPFSVTAV